MYVILDTVVPYSFSVICNLLCVVFRNGKSEILDRI
jgi:hypothetical protein